MSPEQALGEDLDARSDLFSLGSVLYELATGIPAFTGITAPILFQQILTQMPSPPIRLNPELSPKLDDLIGKLLEKDRELRYQTAADVCADLKRMKRDLDIQQGINAGRVHPLPPPVGTSCGKCFFIAEPGPRYPQWRSCSFPLSAIFAQTESGDDTLSWPSLSFRLQVCLSFRNRAISHALNSRILPAALNP